MRRYLVLVVAAVVLGAVVFPVSAGAAVAPLTATAKKKPKKARVASTIVKLAVPSPGEITLGRVVVEIKPKEARRAQAVQAFEAALATTTTISVVGAKKLPSDLIVTGGVKKSSKHKFVVVVAVAHRNERATTASRGQTTPKNIRLKLATSIKKTERTVTNVKQVRDIIKNKTTCLKRLAKTPTPATRYLVSTGTDLPSRWLAKNKVPGYSPKAVLKEATSCSPSDAIKTALAAEAENTVPDPADPPQKQPPPPTPPPPPPEPKTSCSGTLTDFVSPLNRPTGPLNSESLAKFICTVFFPIFSPPPARSIPVPLPQGPVAPATASQFDVVLPGAREVTLWLAPTGFTCNKEIRVTTDDTLRCIGTLAAQQTINFNVRYTGALTPSAELYVLVNGQDQGPFPITRAVPAP